MYSLSVINYYNCMRIWGLRLMSFCLCYSAFIKKWAQSSDTEEVKSINDTAASSWLKTHCSPSL